MANIARSVKIVNATLKTRRRIGMMIAKPCVRTAPVTAAPTTMTMTAVRAPLLVKLSHASLFTETPSSFIELIVKASLILLKIPAIPCPRILNRSTAT